MIYTFPNFRRRPVPPFCPFEEVVADEVLTIIRAAPSKQCSINQIPTWLVVQIAAVLAPAITNMINGLLDEGRFPSSQKEAIVGPRLKRSTLDQAALKSYQPISNLSLKTKFIERIMQSTVSITRQPVSANSSI